MIKVAHRCILLNFEEVQPYIEEHKKELVCREPHLWRNEGALGARHVEFFNEWFKQKIENEKKVKHVSSLLDSLSDGPNPDVVSYKGYMINGHRFHTKDGKKGTQNSGVALPASSLCRASAKDNRKIEQVVTYYYVTKKIILLDYGTFQYPLFKCDWANVGSGIKVEEGLTLVNLH
ncbi:hypothetical protein IFM89_003281 [Coptis chinensis]|uniref:Transposase n=1 Tax=Coptis chinensis TaxID=261450 RepID=A0A835HTI8_9MAGN|nr:hypothetical protein IFM89_003281 [Coptis chinensis]